MKKLIIFFFSVVFLGCADIIEIYKIYAENKKSRGEVIDLLIKGERSPELEAQKEALFNEYPELSLQENFTYGRVFNENDENYVSILYVSDEQLANATSLANMKKEAFILKAGLVESINEGWIDLLQKYDINLVYRFYNNDSLLKEIIIIPDIDLTKAELSKALNSFASFE